MLSRSVQQQLPALRPRLAVRAACLAAVQQRPAPALRARRLHTAPPRHQAAANATHDPPASPGAASSSAASPSPPSPSSSSVPLSSAAEVRWLYRVFLLHARAHSEPAKQQEFTQEIRRQFREPLADGDSALHARIQSAYSKLSFTRMSLPKHQHPPLGPVPPFPGALHLLGSGAGGVSAFTYIGGEIVPASDHAANAASRVVNSQGITDDQVRRHYALIERMQFRGPHWAGKKKF